MAATFSIKDLLYGWSTSFLARSTGAAPPHQTTDPPSEIRHKLVFDSINYFLSKTVPGLTGFMSILVFVRLLGYEEYGRYAVIFGIVMASASGMAAWLGQGILRFQSQATDPRLGGHFSKAANLGSILSVAIGGTGLALALSLSTVQHGSGVFLSTGFFVVLLLYTLALARFQAKLESRRVLQFECIRSLGGFAVPVFIMLLTGARNYRILLLGIAIGYSLPLLMQPLFAGRITKADSTLERTPFDEAWKLLTKLWQFGWPVALWMLCQQWLVVSDRLFIQRYSGYSDAGIYSSMYDVVVRSFSLLFMPVTLAVHPLVMHRWNSGKQRHALSALRSAVRYQVLMFIPIGTVLILTGPWISHIVLGRSFPAAAQIVFPLALSGFLWQTSLLAHKPLEVLCETKRMLAGMLIALAANIVGNWLLVPRYGYRASAYLTVVSSSVYLIMTFVLVPKNKFLMAIDHPHPPRSMHMSGYEPVEEMSAPIS